MKHLIRTITNAIKLGAQKQAKPSICQYHSLNQKIIYPLFGFKQSPENKIKAIEQKIYQLQQQHQQIKNLQDKIPIRFKIIEARQEKYEQTLGGKTTLKYDGYNWDLLQICQIYVQVNQDQECKKLLDQILSNESYVNEFSTLSRIDNLLFLSSLNNFACNFHYERLQNLELSLDFALKGHQINLQLLDEFCPQLQITIHEKKKEVKNPDTQFEIEMNIISNSAQHLFFLSNLYKLMGNIGECIRYLSEKAQLHDQTSHMIQNVIQNKLHPKSTKESAEGVNQQMMQLLVEQAMTFTMIGEKYYEINDETECFNFLHISHDCFDYLIKNQIIDPTHPFYILTLLLSVQAIHKFKSAKYDFNEQLLKLQDVIQKAKVNMPKDIFESLNFDYHLLLQKLSGDKLKTLKDCLDNLKVLNHPQLFEKEIQYEVAVFQTLIQTNKLEEAWTQSIKLLTIFRSKLKVSQIIYLETLIESCDVARQTKKFKDALILLKEIEEKIQKQVDNQYNTYLVDYHLIKGKILIEEQLNGNKNLQEVSIQQTKTNNQIEKGFQQLDKVCEIIEKSNAIDQIVTIYELKAYYYEQLNDSKKAKINLQKCINYLKDSKRNEKDVMIQKINERIEKL